MDGSIDGKSPWDSLSTLPIRPTRRHATAAVLFVGLFFLASDHARVDRYSPLVHRLRQLTHSCASLHDKTTLLSAEEAEQFPMPPLNLPPRQARSNEHYREPSHMRLCREYVARSDALRAQGTDEARAALRQQFMEQPVHVQEQDRTCNHWAAPHWALMEIFSSSLLSTAGEDVGVTYSHDCHRFMGLGDDDGIHQATSRRRLQEEPKDGDVVVLDVPELYNKGEGDGRPQVFNTQEDQTTSATPLNVDHTTVQQILSSGPNLKWNGNKLTEQDVLGLCRGCIHGFDPSRENAQDKSRVTHHCMLFPGVPEVINPPKTTGMDGGMERAPCAPGSDGCEDDKDGSAKATPLEAALPLIRNRVYHAAVDMAERSHFPDFGPRTGVVLYIDGGSIAIAPHLYVQHLPPKEYVTSLHVLASPSCIHSHMPPRDESCKAYASRVTEYLKSVYTPDSTDVQLKYAASSAAAISRMVLSKTCICPPFTLTCIMASLSKQTSKETIMFELDRDMYKSLEGNVSPIAHWMARAGGKAGNIKVVPVSEGELFSDTLGVEGGLGEIGSSGGGSAGGEGELQSEGTLVFSEDADAGMQMVQSVSQRWSNQEDYVFDTNDKKQRRPEPRSFDGMQLVDTSELAEQGRGDGGQAQSQGGEGAGGGRGGGNSELPGSPDEFMVTFDDEDGGDGGKAVGQSGQASAAGMQTSSGGGETVVIPPSEDGSKDDSPTISERSSDRPVESGGGQTWGGGSAGAGPQRTQARPLDAGGSGAAAFELPESDDEDSEGDASNLRFSSATPESGGESTNQQNGQRDVDQAPAGQDLETNEEGKPVFQKVQGAPESGGGGSEGQPGQDGGAGSTNNFAGGGGGGGRFGGRRNLDNPTLRGKAEAPPKETSPAGKGPGRSIREQSPKDATAAAKP